MLAESVLALLVLQLGTVQIAIDFDGATVVVRARYGLDVSSGILHFNIIRFPGQEVRFINADRSNVVSNDTLAGLYRLTFDSSSAPVVIDYAVSGNLSRIPLPVPNAVTEPGGRSVTISIRGLGADASLGDGFPRFQPRSDDTAVAELDNVPGFVRVPPDTAQWSVNRMSEAIVILLIALASAVWVLRRWRPKRSHQYPMDPF